MKRIRFILVVGFILLLFAPVALAQDVEIPQTAVGALGALSLLLASVGGLLAGIIIDWVKTLPFLTGEQKEGITGPAAKLIAALVSSGTGLLVAYLMPYAVELDTGGGYAIILAILTMLANKGIFEIEGYRRAFGR